MTSISRRNAAQRFARSSERLTVFRAVQGQDPKTAEEMAPDEVQRTDTWFDAQLRALSDAIVECDQAIPTAAADDQPELVRLKTRLVGEKADTEQAQEAFFTKRTLALRPPSDAVIAETRRLGEALAARIAAEKKAQAAVKLLDDLAGVFVKLEG